MMFSRSSLGWITAVVLALPIAAYVFTPLLDEWVIEKSIGRFCDGVKEQFTGEEFSYEYLCLFVEGTE